MATILSREQELLCKQFQPIISRLLQKSLASAGDLALTECALECAVKEIRPLLVSSAVRTCVSSADRQFVCPDCSRELTHWGSTARTIVTSSGEGVFESERYRCRSCKSSHYPWQASQGLDGRNQLTLGARALIAEEAACAPFDLAAQRLNRMGLAVSASEVDRVAREVGTWRKQEQEVVRSVQTQGGSLRLPLQDWSEWPSDPSDNDIVVFSVDGAKVRSPEQGEQGSEWFEVRSGIVRYEQGNGTARKACIGGVMDADQLFETLRSQWWQSPSAWRQKGSRLRKVFIADGADWIWDRARWHFPDCIQILDIYHAAEHVGSAARAAWGADAPKANTWVSRATALLTARKGIQAILKQLVEVLRTDTAVNKQALATEMRYLWRHRHKMRYAQWRASGLPIGSGAMESTIKQLSTQRLCLAGMMWTRKHADLMMHLRSAVLSDALRLTIGRERVICLNRASKYYKQAI